MGLLQLLDRTSIRASAAAILVLTLSGCAHREFSLEPAILPEEIAAERATDQAWQEYLNAAAEDRANGVEFSAESRAAMDLWLDSELARHMWRLARESPSPRERAEELSNQVKSRLAAIQSRRAATTPAKP